MIGCYLELEDVIVVVVDKNFINEIVVIWMNEVNLFCK